MTNEPTQHTHEHAHAEAHDDIKRRRELVTEREAIRAALAADRPGLGEREEEARAKCQRSREAVVAADAEYARRHTAYVSRANSAAHQIAELEAELRSTASPELTIFAQWLTTAMARARKRWRDGPSAPVAIQEALREVEAMRLEALDQAEIDERITALKAAIGGGQ